MTYGMNKQEVELFLLPTPWIHDVNWTLLDVHKTSWMSYEYLLYVQLKSCVQGDCSDFQQFLFIFL